MQQSAAGMRRYTAFRLHGKLLLLQLLTFAGRCPRRVCAYVNRLNASVHYFLVRGHARSRLVALAGALVSVGVAGARARECDVGSPFEEEARRSLPPRPFGASSERAPT